MLVCLVVHPACKPHVQSCTYSCCADHADSNGCLILVLTVQAYQRQLLLEKIMEENDKTEQLLMQRRFIQEQRKAANMTASLHRNKVNQLMESMKTSHNIEKLAPNDTIDLAALRLSR